MRQQFSVGSKGHTEQSKAKNSFPPSDWCSASSGRWGPITVTVTWTKPLLLRACPPLLLLLLHAGMMAHGLGHLRGQLGVPWSSCVSQSPRVPLHPPEEQNRPQLCAQRCSLCHTPERAPCSHKPRHSPLQSLPQDSFTGARYAGTWLAHTNTAALKEK